jgi:hypothetical protein
MLPNHVHIHEAAHLRVTQALLEILFIRLFRHQSDPAKAVSVFQGELSAMLSQTPLSRYGVESEQVKGEAQQYATEFVARIRTAIEQNQNAAPQTTNLIDA